MTIVNMVGGGIGDTTEYELSSYYATATKFFCGESVKGSHTSYTVYPYYFNGSYVIANATGMKIVSQIGLSSSTNSQSGYYRTITRSGNYVGTSSSDKLSAAILSAAKEGKTYSGTIVMAKAITSSQAFGSNSNVTVNVDGNKSSVTYHIDGIRMDGYSSTYDSTVSAYLVPLVGTLVYD